MRNVDGLDGISAMANCTAKCPLMTQSGHCCPKGQLPDNRLRQQASKISGSGEAYQEVVMSKVVAVGATALFTCILCATPLSVRLSPQGTVALFTDGASAEIGRPLTAGSVAGVHRRAHRRAYRRGYYASDYGTYQPYGTYQYGYAYQPQYGYAYQPQYGYAYQPGWRFDRNRYYQQPYSGYGYRHWSEF